MTRSIRARLLVGTALGVACAFVATGSTAYLLARRNAVADFDAALVARARSLSALVENQDDGLHSDILSRRMPELAAGGAEAYQLWIPDGTAVEKSPSLGARDLPFEAVAIDGVALADVTLPSGATGRRATVAFIAAVDGDPAKVGPRHAVLAAVRPTEALERTLAGLRRALGIAGALGTVSCVAVLAWIAQFALRPLRALAGQIAAASPTIRPRASMPRACPSSSTRSRVASMRCCCGCARPSRARGRSAPTSPTSYARRSRASWPRCSSR